MSYRAYRNPGMWSIGWSSDRGWLNLCGFGGTICLDVWHWRIRWAGRNHRPLFSERYGYTKWHTLGRLGFHYAKPRRDKHRETR